MALPHPKSYDTTSIDGVVVDNVTGLQWQQVVDGPSDGGTGLYTWNQAKTTCANLPLAGGGWRLPTRIELVSILDTTRSNPSINVTAFPDTPPDAFWASTVLVGVPSSAWIIYLSDGSASYYDLGNMARAR